MAKLTYSLGGKVVAELDFRGPDDNMVWERTPVYSGDVLLGTKHEMRVKAFVPAEPKDAAIEG